MRLTDLDGKLPNLALMKISAWHRAQGDEVNYTPLPQRQLYEPQYDRVYASSIFKADPDGNRAAFLADFPEATVGGTGFESKITVEEIIGQE